MSEENLVSDSMEGYAPEQDVRAPGVVHEIPSLCMYCHEEGMTRLLMTSIPFFKEVLVSSFLCPHCHYKDTSVTSAASLGDNHVTYALKVDAMMDSEEDVARNLSRTIIRSESARILIPELEFEIPPKRPEINTIEGLLMNIRESLSAGQPERLTNQPEAHDKIETVIATLEMMQEGRENFTIVIEDAAGNSFISNPDAPALDKFCTVTSRPRTREETIALGFSPDDPLLNADVKPMEKEEREALIKKAMLEITRQNAAAKGNASAPARGDHYKSGGSKAALKAMSSAFLNKEDLEYDHMMEQTELQSAVFKDICHDCGHPNETRMCIIDIPYFRSTIIMCTDCEYCGFKDTDIKAGGGVADLGCQIALKVTSTEDLSRDVLKSDFSAIRIPELDLEVTHGTLGGKFSTVEGLLIDVRSHLTTNLPFYSGDSSESEQKAKYTAFLQGMDDLFDVKTPFTFILDDPSGNSFIEGRVDGVHDTDPREDTMITFTEYERNEKQNDDLGLTNMLTEGYFDADAIAAAKAAEAVEEDEDDEDEDDEEDAEE